MTIESLLSTRELESRIASMIRFRPLAGGEIRIVGRTANVEAGGHSSEILSILVNGSAISAFHKYGASIAGRAHGQRGGLAREVLVYERLLAALPQSHAGFFGSYQGDGSDASSLLIEHIDGAIELCSHEALKHAARWIAEFHQRMEAAEPSATSFLPRYDIEYFLGWYSRASSFTDASDGDRSWLEAVLERFRDSIPRLVEGSPTVIHGEYYPNNILARNTSVYPVDWESTAIGPGEIDLATLCEGWPRSIAEDAWAEYAAVRWQGDPPTDWEARLEAAHLYVAARWLGERADMLHKAIPKYRTWLLELGIDVSPASAHGSVGESRP